MGSYASCKTWDSRSTLRSSSINELPIGLYELYGFRKDLLLLLECRIQNTLWWCGLCQCIDLSNSSIPSLELLNLQYRIQIGRFQSARVGIDFFGKVLLTLDDIRLYVTSHFYCDFFAHPKIFNRLFFPYNLVCKQCIAWSMPSVPLLFCNIGVAYLLGTSLSSVISFT